MDGNESDVVPGQVDRQARAAPDETRDGNPVDRRRGPANAQPGRQPPGERESHDEGKNDESVGYDQRKLPMLGLSFRRRRTRQPLDQGLRFLRPRGADEVTVYPRDNAFGQHPKPNCAAPRPRSNQRGRPLQSTAALRTEADAEQGGAIA